LTRNEEVVERLKVACNDDLDQGDWSTMIQTKVVYNNDLDQGGHQIGWGSSG